MSVDRRGNTVHSVASNRAPMYTDGLAPTNTLLTTTSEKTIIVKDSKAQPAVAQRMIVKNESGQTAELTLHVAFSVDGSQEDVMTAPIYLANNETLELYVRVERVVEKNTGGGTQTGRGVRYWFELEPGRP